MATPATTGDHTGQMNKAINEPNVGPSLSHSVLDAAYHPTQPVASPKIAPSRPTRYYSINQPPSYSEAEAVLKSVNLILNSPEHSGQGHKSKKLKRLTIRRYMAIQSCLNYFLGSNVSFERASDKAAAGQGRKKASGRSIRRWIRIYIEEGDLPLDRYGWWNVSILEDEDVTAAIRHHCMYIGKYVTAAHIVAFLDDPAVRARLGLEKSITVRTAEKWLHRSGYKWGKARKGQYFEGHEREDVVAYRQTKYLPAWKEFEGRMAVYTPDGKNIDFKLTLPLGVGTKQVIVWFHDESTFFAHDRRLIRWVYIGEHPTLSKKGEGNSVMVANFVCAERGWMKGTDGSIARKILRAGKNRDGYFTNEDVVEQLRNAIELVHREYPNQTHVFVYDNAPSHMKRPVGAVSSIAMTKGPKEVFKFKYIDSHGVESMVPMEDGRLHNGTRQSFYFPCDHATMPGWFKGMKNILVERGLRHIGQKNAQCALGCDPQATDCCCRRALSCEPDFETRDTIIEELAHSLGSKVIILPKYHCELNPIEQCWGYAKGKYRLFPDSSTQLKLEENMLKALDSIPEHTIRKFAARSRRFVDAYAAAKNGKEAIEWVNHKERVSSVQSG